MRASSDHIPSPAVKWTDSWDLGARAGVLIPVDESAFARIRSDWLVDLDPVKLGLHDIAVWTGPRVESTLGVDLGLRF